MGTAACCSGHYASARVNSEWDNDAVTHPSFSPQTQALERLSGLFLPAGRRVSGSSQLSPASRQSLGLITQHERRILKRKHP
jgi:hypothetical protein